MNLPCPCKFSREMTARGLGGEREGTWRVSRCRLEQPSIDLPTYRPMANAPHPIEKTLRVQSDLHISLSQFLEEPSAARSADLIARIHGYRRAVEANLLALPRVLRSRA